MHAVSELINATQNSQSRCTRILTSSRLGTTVASAFSWALWPINAPNDARHRDRVQLPSWHQAAVMTFQEERGDVSGPWLFHAMLAKFGHSCYSLPEPNEFGIQLGHEPERQQNKLQPLEHTAWEVLHTSNKRISRHESLPTQFAFIQVSFSLLQILRSQRLCRQIRICRASINAFSVVDVVVIVVVFLSILF